MWQIEFIHCYSYRRTNCHRWKRNWTNHTKLIIVYHSHRVICSAIQYIYAEICTGTKCQCESKQPQNPALKKQYKEYLVKSTGEKQMGIKTWQLYLSHQFRFRSAKYFSALIPLHTQKSSNAFQIGRNLFLSLIFFSIWLQISFALPLSSFFTFFSMGFWSIFLFSKLFEDAILKTILLSLACRLEKSYVLLFSTSSKQMQNSFWLNFSFNSIYSFWIKFKSIFPPS